MAKAGHSDVEVDCNCEVYCVDRHHLGLKRHALNAALWGQPWAVAINCDYDTLCSGWSYF